MSTVRQISLKMIPESGEADNDTDHLGLLDSWVIGVLAQIADAWDWDCLKQKETILTVASQAEYSLQTISATMKQVRTPVDDIQLEILTEDDLRGYDLEAEGTLLAVYYSGYDTTTKQDKIKFYLVPSESDIEVEIEQRLRIDEETYNGDTEIPFPSDFNELIKQGVRVRINVHNRDFQQAAIERKAFDDLLEGKRARSMNLGERFVRRECDIPKRRQWGLRRDPAHYRTDF